MVGISVDPPERNTAMVAKLSLPFPLLADPEGEGAIKAYGVWHEGRPFARPAVILIAPDGTEILRQVGEDFADRLPEEELVEAVRRLGLAPVAQDPPAPGDPHPGDKAVDLAWLPAYFRGAKFAVMGLAGRVSEVRKDAKVMSEEYDRFLGALKWLKEKEESKHG